MTLEDLKTKYRQCSLCDKCMTDRKVFGHGNINANIMVVGEGPGREEVQKGIPFIGTAGKLLDKILNAVYLNREDLYYSNTIICRTDEKNRTPGLKEMRNCAARLNEEISIVRPNIILMAGSSALKRFFGTGYKITEVHGEWFMDMNREEYPRCFALMHPAWLLHSVSKEEEAAKKRIMWIDIKKFKHDLDTLNFDVEEKKDGAK